MPIYPISFSIPEEKVVSEVPVKTKTFAQIRPGDTSTYTFTDEASYYGDYQASLFGHTQKKGGWDCLRHYEILANGCIPWFRDLDKCPERTMVHFPKDLVHRAMNSTAPREFLPELLEHTRTHLTCRAMAQYVLTTAGCPTPKRVLFLSGDPRPDYLRCLTLIGLKQCLGDGCVESVGIPHIYDDCPNPSSLYGRGFTYSRVLPASLKPPPIHIDELRSGAFDLVIYGSMHRGMPYLEDVLKAYPPSKIVALCGEDCDEFTPDHHACTLGQSLSDKGFHVFVRELV